MVEPGVTLARIFSVEFGKPIGIALTRRLERRKDMFVARNILES